MPCKCLQRSEEREIRAFNWFDTFHCTSRGYAVDGLQSLKYTKMTKKIFVYETKAVIIWLHTWKMALLLYGCPFWIVPFYCKNKFKHLVNLFLAGLYSSILKFFTPFSQIWKETGGIFLGGKNQGLSHFSWIWLLLFEIRVCISIFHLFRCLHIASLLSMPKYFYLLWLYW